MLHRLHHVLHATVHSWGNGKQYDCSDHHVHDEGKYHTSLIGVTTEELLIDYMLVNKLQLLYKNWNTREFSVLFIP